MDGAEAWTRFVEALSTQREMIDQLSAEHVPNADGLCRACTTPGRGTPQKAWPCPMWTLADAARALRAQRSVQ